MWNHYKAEKNRQTLLLHIVTWLTCFNSVHLNVVQDTTLALAGILYDNCTSSFPYVVFLPVFLITTSKDKNFNIYNTVFVLSCCSQLGFFCTPGLECFKRKNI
jgi:hypothetical protein